MSISKRNLLIGLIILIAVAGAIVIYWLSNQASDGVGIQTSLRRVHNVNASFSIEYPVPWSYVEVNGDRGDKSIVGYILSPRLPGLGTEIMIRKGPMVFDSLDSVIEWGKEVAMKNQGYAALSDRGEIINGEMTSMHNYTWRTPKTPLIDTRERRCVDSYRYFQGRGYILTLCDDTPYYANLEPTFNQIISNFQFE